MKNLTPIFLTIIILLGFHFYGTAQNVGIGTTNPQFGRLMIEANAVPLSFRETGVAPENGGLWRMPLDAGILRFDVNTGTAGNEFTGGNLISSVLAMTPQGNVGIGTISPDNKLHVYLGNSGVATPYVRSSLVLEDGDHTYLSLLTPNNRESGILFGNPSNAISGGIVYNTSSLTNGLQFRTNGNVSRMAIDQNGNVGINTNAPLHDLHVNGTTQTTYLQPGFKSAEYEFYRFGNPTNFFAGFMNNISNAYYGNGNNFAIFTYENRDIVLRAGSSGNISLNPTGSGRVGIGTASPAAKLDVRGDIRWGTSGASLTTNQGAAIELRGTGVPFIDFSNDAAIDYDARIILASNNRLTVDGAEFCVLNTISAKRVKVTTTGYPDYVFKDDYKLKSLAEVQQFIDKNGHLPGVPSEKEIVKNGLDLNDQSMWQQEKIEELFLHMIENEKRVNELVKEVSDLKKENQELRKENTDLKSE